MKKQQVGFTFFELVLAIVIIGIIAATAIPSFIDVRSGTKSAEAESLAGTLGSASASNFSLYRLNPGKSKKITDCTAIGPLIEGCLDSAFEISAKTLNPGDTAQCELKHKTGNEVAMFTGHGT